MSTGPGEPPVVGAGQPWYIRVRGILFATLMLLSALLGSMYIITPMLPLLFWNPKMWRKCMDRLVGFWIIYPGTVMKFMFMSKVSVYGDRIDRLEPAVIIMNHRTRLDWLFFWNALYKIDPWLCTSEKISLKGILRYVPGAGWAMGSNSYIFLDRSYETDQVKLDSMLEYYAKIGYNYQLLLFPEGTDKCPKATERSRLFAEKKGLVHYDYVLHPRTTGFVHIVQNMRNAKYIKYIYDVTIGFGDIIVQSEIDLAAHGVAPTDIHYHIRKIPIAEIPETDKDLAEWLIQLWKKKEEQLRIFYSKQGNERRFEGEEIQNFSPRASQIQCFVVFLWTGTTAFWLHAFFQYSWLFYFGILSCIIFSVIQYLYGGVEWLTIQKFAAARATEPVPLDPTNKDLPIPSTPHYSDSD